MTNYVKRLLYVDAKGTKINPLFYPFLFATIVYGLGFSLLGGWSGVNTSSLFGAMSNLHNWLPTLWGVCALLAGGFAVAMMLLRHAPLGSLAAMFGFLVWLFAGFVYLLNGYYLVLLTVTFPNVYFWVFYYMRLAWYNRAKKAGLIVDAG